MKTYEKMLMLVELIAQAGALSPKELLSQIDVPRSTLQALLKTLTDRHWLIRGTDGYRLGPQLGGIGGAYLASVDVRTIALPHLRRLADRWNMTVHLGVMANDDNAVVYIDKVAKGPLPLRSEIGKVVPLHSTALGKLLLALSPSDVQHRIIQRLELTPITPNTITQHHDFLTVIRRVAETQIAWDAEENEMGITCIAAPIRDFQGRVIAAVSVSGVSESMLAQSAQMVEDLKHCCGAISWELGWMTPNNKLEEGHV